MGEAKRRAEAASQGIVDAGQSRRQITQKESSPFHRGLVLRPPYRKLEPIGFVLGMDDPHEMRLGALYWDKIASPSLDFLRQSSPDHEILEREGVLTRPRMHMPNGFTLEGPGKLIRAHLATYDELEKQDSGKWALSQGNRQELFGTSVVTKNTGLLVELVEALPVPLVDTPVDSILEFRLKRRSELLHLRSAIDEIHAKALSSENAQDAINKSAQDIEKACLDLIAASREQWKIFNLTDLQTLFAGSATSMVMEAAAHAHLPTVAGALGIGSTAVKIAKDVGLRRKAFRSSPYWYIAKFHREVMR